jgi:hypothetical protein
MGKPLKYLTFGITALLASACGLIKGGDGGLVNDLAPSNATVVFVGELTPVKSGTDIRGSVAIYRGNSQGEYLIRLQALTGARTSLAVAGEAGGTQIYQLGLKGASGNQNYATGNVTPGLSWTTVSIVDPTISSVDPARVYSRATLQAYP